MTEKEFVARSIRAGEGLTLAKPKDLQVLAAHFAVKSGQRLPKDVYQNYRKEKKKLHDQVTRKYFTDKE